MEIRNRPASLARYNVAEGVLSSGKLDTYKGAYVAISYYCNLDICEYCYARGQAVTDTMSIESFQKMLGWLSDLSALREVQIVGGEPTTIEDLGEYLDALQRQMFRATPARDPKAASQSVVRSGERRRQGSRMPRRWGLTACRVGVLWVRPGG